MPTKVNHEHQNRATLVIQKTSEVKLKELELTCHSLPQVFPFLRAILQREKEQRNSTKIFSIFFSLGHISKNSHLDYCP